MNFKFYSVLFEMPPKAFYVHGCKLMYSLYCIILQIIIQYIIFDEHLYLNLFLELLMIIND